VLFDVLKSMPHFFRHICNRDLTGAVTFGLLYLLAAIGCENNGPWKTRG